MLCLPELDIFFEFENFKLKLSYKSKEESLSFLLLRNGRIITFVTFRDIRNNFNFRLV